jgi:hypothetical protein
VGPYQVVDLIGTGGMAEVYRARDSRLGRDVALKVVSEPLGADSELLARLEREAKLGGSLNHPNVVAVYDVGLHGGSPYFVTELLQGETLRQRLAKGTPALPTALEWASQMAQGLAAAHEQGIIHRDLKPENVFLTRDGQVKLLDFGIAKLAEAARAAIATGRDGLMDETASPSGGTTGTGMVLGTPGYMSPEQARGDLVDARTDFFSLGVVIYELLSGRRAFPSGPLVESGYAILHDEPEPLPASVPLQVAQVVHRCLEKEPARRFQSARDLAFHLEALRTPTGSGAPVPAVTRRSRWRRWGPLTAAAALLLGIAGAAYFAGSRSRLRASVARVEPITFRQGTVSAARFTLDGRVVFSAAWEGQPSEVFVRASGSLEAQPLGLHDVGLLGVSPTGELALSVHPPVSLPIFVFMGGGIGTLALVPGAGGAPRELAENVWYADWSPTGELAVVRVMGGKRQLEFPLGTSLFETSGALLNPRVSPRGDSVAVIHSTYSADELLLVDRQGHVRMLRTPPTEPESVEQKSSEGASTRIFPRSSPRSAAPTGLAWLPNGEEVWFSSRDAIWADSLSGGLRRVYQGINEIRLEDISQAGAVLVNAQDSRREITFVAPAGERERRLSLLGSGELGAISDDGRKVLFTEESPDGSFLTYIRRTDGSPPVKIGTGYALSLSADEKWVLLLPDYRRNSFRRVLSLLPIGAGVPKTVAVSGVNVVLARLLRDGKRIVLIGQPPDEKQPRLYVMPLEGGVPRPISPPLVPSYFDVSRDDRLAVALGLDQVVTLFPVEGGPPVPLPELGRDVVPAGWTADGQLWASRFREVPTRLLRFDIRSRRVVEERSIGPSDPTGVTRITRVRITPDGRSLAFDDERALGTLHLVDGLVK